MRVQTVPTLVWAVRVDRVLLLRDDNQPLVVGCCGKMSTGSMRFRRTCERHMALQGRVCSGRVQGGIASGGFSRFGGSSQLMTLVPGSVARLGGARLFRSKI